MTLFQAFGQFAGSGAVEQFDFEFVSVASFSAVSTASLDNVFSADFEQYLIVDYTTGSVDDQSLRGALRASGTDATGSDYANERFACGGGGSFSAGRTTGAAYWDYFMGVTGSTRRNISWTWVYNPYRAQETTFYNECCVAGSGTPTLRGTGGVHSLSNSYDGFSITPASGTLTGEIYVYGLRE